jgi:chemotaxis protein CheX
MSNSQFVKFSKPFLDALKETYEMMVQTEIKPHTPTIKDTPQATGDITSMIGMNGVIEQDGETKDFKGLMAISWPEDVYIKLASRMLFEEYTEYNEEIADTGSEIANIVMGNAKNGLTPLGFKIDMASPSTVRGKSHEIKYPPKTTVIAITISCDVGDFTIELCYQEIPKAA